IDGAPLLIDQLERPADLCLTRAGFGEGDGARGLAALGHDHPGGHADGDGQGEEGGGEQKDGTARHRGSHAKTPQRRKPGYRSPVSRTEDPSSSQLAERLAGWLNMTRRSRGLSLRTLVILRWMAIVGQSATIAIAVLGFHFDLPLL